MGIRIRNTGFGTAPAPEIFYPEPAPAPDKENIILEFFKTDKELSKIPVHSNAYTIHMYRYQYITYGSYFMFTLEKTSNEVKFRIICVNY